MTGKINAFYGAEVFTDKGQPAGVITNKTEVEIVEPFGKPAFRTGEWVKVKSLELAGWVKADQVNADYD